MDNGIDFQALGECFSDLCKNMLEEECPGCESAIDCILYPRCSMAAKVTWDPDDELGWALDVFLMEEDDEDDQIFEGEEAHISFDFCGLTPEDTEVLWNSLQSCRFGATKYRENIERLLRLVWEGVSGEIVETAPFPSEVNNFLEMAESFKEDDDDAFGYS
jgi:hypothetical protein